MRMYMYSYHHIDWGWENLQTVKEYLKNSIYKGNIVDEGEIKCSDGYKIILSIFKQKVIEAEDFIACLNFAKKAAGFEGDFSEEPRVFFIPEGGNLSIGFLWKQPNNGTTFIASPVLLQHLGHDGNWSDFIGQFDTEEFRDI